MNQGQWTGERLARCDPQWSPLAVALDNIADELLHTVRCFGPANQRVLSALGDASGGMSLPQLREYFPDRYREDVQSAALSLVANGLVMRSGERGAYIYKLVTGEGVCRNQEGCGSL